MTAVDLKPEITRDQFLAYIEPLRSGERDQVYFETVHKRKDGSTYPVEVRLQYSPKEDPPVYVAILLDISEQKKAEERLNNLAYYDSLTGLPNRSLFVDRLEQAMKEARIYPTTLRISMGNESVKDLIAAFVNSARTHIDQVNPGFTEKFMSGDEIDVLVEEVTIETYRNMLAIQPKMNELLLN